MVGGARQAAATAELTTPVYFLPVAEAELWEARQWYELRVAGYGDLFVAAVDSLVSRLSGDPEQFPIVHANLRRGLLKRFPYALYFRIEADGAYVVACAHTSRDPRRWQRRA